MIKLVFIVNGYPSSFVNILNLKHYEINRKHYVRSIGYGYCNKRFIVLQMYLENTTLIFCCGGKMPLGVACELRGLNERELADELMHTESIFPLAKSWPLDFIVDFLVHAHHNYFKNNTEIVKEYVDRFTMSHIKIFRSLKNLPS